MDIPVKTLTNNFALPVYGLGTWQMGGGYDRNPAHDEKDIEAMRTAIDLGVTHVDTAEIYGNGHAEELVGRAIKNYNRSHLFITSKVAADHARHDDVVQALHGSLQRLQTDYLDMYLIHWPNHVVPLSETMAAMSELKDHGQIRNIGVSNFSKERLAKAQNHTNHKIVTNQVHYSLMVREPEITSLLSYCQNNDVLLTAYRPVKKGLLAEPGVPIVDELCVKYEKTPAQIAINWLISQQNVITIAKTSHTDHLKENLGALDWTMEPTDIEKLRRQFPEQLSVSDIAPLS